MNVFLKCLQALLRGRFLRNDRPVDNNRPLSVAESELGFLRRRQTVSGLRYEFLYDIKLMISTTFFVALFFCLYASFYQKKCMTSCALAFLRWSISTVWLLHYVWWLVLKICYIHLLNVQLIFIAFKLLILYILDSNAPFFSEFF